MGMGGMGEFQMGEYSMKEIVNKGLEVELESFRGQWQDHCHLRNHLRKPPAGRQNEQQDRTGRRAGYCRQEELLSRRTDPYLYPKQPAVL